MTWRAYLEPRDTRAAAVASSRALVTASVIALGYELPARSSGDDVASTATPGGVPSSRVPTAALPSRRLDP